MAEEINFLDLATLSKIGPDTVVEKYGALINSSFFDASNILGTLKLKGLIDFSTIFPGQNGIKITDSGKQLLDEAAAKSSDKFDELDFAIISHLSSSKRTLQELTGAVNLRPRDLALHIFKLVQQQYASYTIRNGNLDITLTEKGFLQAKAGMPKPEPSPEQQSAAAAQQMESSQSEQNTATSSMGGGTAQPNQATEAMQGMMQDTVMPSRSNKKIAVAAVVIVIIVIALLALRSYGYFMAI
jgi:hypothetical protein